jgi:uncharacterized NAD-dependent epimerase/dehydratase family protein
VSDIQPDGTALILCEGAFGTPQGKTAHGLVRFTRRYRILGVIDSQHAGQDAGMVLDGRACGVPIFATLGGALRTVKEPVQYLIIGVAPDGGLLPRSYRPIVREAIENGLNIDSGLHEFLSEDPEFAALAANHGVRLRDVRKPPPRHRLHFYSGKIDQVAALRIAVLGTDSAVGKRTTMLALHHALQEKGIRSEMIGTGQTAWLQGLRYCVMLDSIVNDFVTGEIEHCICRAAYEQNPQIILLEGQGSLTHPAYPGGFELIAAGKPHAIVLQHAPRRRCFDGFPQYTIGDLAREIQLLELFSQVKVLALTLNHEGMNREEIEKTVEQYEMQYRIPVCDVLVHGCEKLVRALLERFPELRANSHK